MCAQEGEESSGRGHDHFATSLAGSSWLSLSQGSTTEKSVILEAGAHHSATVAQGMWVPGMSLCQSTIVT